MKPLHNLPDDEFERLLHQAVALPDAPPAWLRAATGLHAAMQPPQDSIVHAVLRRVSAILSFDSWAVSPLAAGVRAVRSQTRHLLFSAQGRDIDLRITPVAAHFTLTGQLLGPDESGQIELLRQSEDGPSEAATALDALGEFRLDGVRTGSYVLKLRLGDDEIVLPPIAIGAPGR